MTGKEFNVNEYITLKLEDNKTIIHVAGKRFNQCKYLLFQINLDQVPDYEEIQSIDMMEQRDRSQGFKKLKIPALEEFWGHCSNLQAWIENDYDTRLLHRNLAFPLLKRLTELGDPIAKRVFKEEIIYRLEEGNENVVRYLYEGGFLNSFSSEEMDILFHSIKSREIRILFWGIQNEAPQSFYNNLDNVRDNLKLAKWGVQNNASSAFYNNLDKVRDNLKLAKWAVQKNVPWYFYEYFDQLNENEELAKWGFQNNARSGFYKYFGQLQENVNLAKFGVQNNVSSGFYKFFPHLKGNVDLYKWGIQNNVNYQFYRNFTTLCENPSTIKSLPIKKELKDKFLKLFSEDKKVYIH